MNATPKSSHDVWAGIDYQPAVRDFFPEELLPHLAAGSRILDVGCGTGSVVRFLTEHGFDAEGLDLNPVAIETARTHASSAGLPPARYHRADFLSFDAESRWDAITMIRFLTCIPEQDSWEQCIDKASRLLTPGGMLYLHDFLLDPASPVYGPRYAEGSACGWREGNFAVQHSDGSLQFVAHHHTEEDLAFIHRWFDRIAEESHPSQSMNGNPCLMFRFIGKVHQSPTTL